MRRESLCASGIIDFSATSRNAAGVVGHLDTEEVEEESIRDTFRD